MDHGLAFSYEFANAFQAAIRRKRTDAVYRDSSVAELMLLPITIDPHAKQLRLVGDLAAGGRFSLTVYDAAYLELAHRHSLPIATLDRELREAAAGANIECLGE
jgi:predicted nucleic acid-binding protein